jgi:RNA polymerase sigma-70 factor (ECF subfamily)
VRLALSRLSQRQRTVIIMHKYQDMEYTEIAQRLDCSLQCVKSLLFRAHSALQDQLMYSEVSLMRRPERRLQEQ